MSLIAAATVSDDWDDARGGEEETTEGKLVSWVVAMGGGELGKSGRDEGGGGRLLSGAGEGGGRREPKGSKLEGNRCFVSPLSLC